MARRIAARVVQKVPVAHASLSESRAFHVRDKSLRGQSRVPASSALARLHHRANSAGNETISALKKPWIKGANSKVGSRKRRLLPPQKTDYGDRMNKIFKINCGYSVNSVDSV